MLRAGRKRGLLVVWLVVFLLLALPLYGQSILTQAVSGTGFVVSSDGYILTNRHVIQGATDVTVQIGGDEYKAQVVTSLSDNDIALLKIDAHGLPTVMLGDSDMVQIGDTIYAIGCPAGVCGTITAGRVANLGISKTDEGTTLHNLIMSDLTTTHGSSGGPLLNDKGEVIGITTAGIVVQGETTGFGVSIPINQAIPLLRQVPGFSTSQMGQAGAKVALKEIRACAGQAVVFLTSTHVLALTDLIPSSFLGYQMGSTFRSPCLSRVNLPSGRLSLCGSEINSFVVHKIQVANCVASTFYRGMPPTLAAYGYYGQALVGEDTDTRRLPDWLIVIDAFEFSSSTRANEALEEVYQYWRLDGGFQAGTISVKGRPMYFSIQAGTDQFGYPGENTASLHALFCLQLEEILFRGMFARKLYFSIPESQWGGDLSVEIMDGQVVIIDTLPLEGDKRFRPTGTLFDAFLNAFSDFIETWQSLLGQAGIH